MTARQMEPHIPHATTFPSPYLEWDARGHLFLVVHYANGRVTRFDRTTQACQWAWSLGGLVQLGAAMPEMRGEAAAP